MKRSKYAIAVAFLMLFTFACGSMNRATPRGMDDAAIEADVRGKIATAVPSKTFAVEVKVNRSTVTLTGHAKSEEDRRKIADAANSVNGVRTVINNITLEP